MHFWYQTACQEMQRTFLENRTGVLTPLMEYFMTKCIIKNVALNIKKIKLFVLFKILNFRGTFGIKTSFKFLYSVKL